LNPLDNIRDCLNRGRIGEAKGLALAFTRANPSNADGWFQLARAHTQLTCYGQALASAERGLALAPRHPTGMLVSIESKLGLGRIAEALTDAHQLERERSNDPSAIVQIGYCYTRTNRHKDAARCFERVRVLQPGNYAVLHNLAGSYVALGEPERAGRLYEELLRKEPRAYETYYTRGTLGRQTPEKNHVAEIERVLAVVPRGGAAEVPLCFALAKELEDLGEWKRSFEFLKRGADIRHKLAAYDVDADLGAMDDIKHYFDSNFRASAATGAGSESPIFVLGMPRTGTTLIDRILCSHSQVGSVGECDEFFRALVRAAHGEGAKLDLKRAGPIAWDRVGTEYRRAVAGIEPDRSRLVDKTLPNFLYIGPILTALPGAKIVHVRRNAMDTCYAVYKTLFRQAFEYSYDLTGLGRYYLGYKAMMEHWAEVLPGRFLTVDYEELVGGQEQASRRLVAFCGLEWEDACLSFEKNASPSFTASAAQVREPIYTSSVQLWRHYESELAPLRLVLEEGGCNIA
jgi:tetratricopeptide (TPR) repeat protein